MKIIVPSNFLKINSKNLRNPHYKFCIFLFTYIPNTHPLRKRKKKQQCLIYTLPWKRDAIYLYNIFLLYMCVNFSSVLCSTLALLRNSSTETVIISVVAAKRANGFSNTHTHTHTYMSSVYIRLLLCRRQSPATVCVCVCVQHRILSAPAATTGFSAEPPPGCH